MLSTVPGTSFEWQSGERSKVDALRLEFDAQWKHPFKVTPYRHRRPIVDEYNSGGESIYRVKGIEGLRAVLLEFFDDEDWE